MEINKCLEDPNTQYSDQYMPLAMMPAVVEAIQNAGGGGGAFIVEYTTSTDKTFNEIKTTILAGTPVYLHVLSGGADYYYSVAKVYIDEHEVGNEFYSIDFASYGTLICIDPDNTMQLSD